MVAASCCHSSPLSWSLHVDGIFGECLFWVLRLTLGTDVYDMTAHLGWVKIYSRILGIVIPIAIRYELENQESIQEKTQKRFQGFTTSHWNAPVHYDSTAAISSASSTSTITTTVNSFN